MSEYLYAYPPLQAGVLIKRYKRFFADIELASGEVITAHCPNTGPMTGVCTPGSAVQVSYHDNPKRKLAYTWELIQTGDREPTWVGINTNLPNRIVKLALEKHCFPELRDRYTQIQTEVRYGVENKSRIDFVLHGGNEKPIYLEVKNTTWVQSDRALFPDTVTVRGQKHLRELMALQGQGTPVMLYFINRSDRTRFSPGDEADPTYGRLLREAIKCGVEVLPYRFEVSPEGIRYLGRAELIL